MLPFELTNFVLNVFCLLNSNAVPVLSTPSALIMTSYQRFKGALYTLDSMSILCLGTRLGLKMTRAGTELVCIRRDDFRNLIDRLISTSRADLA